MRLDPKDMASIHSNTCRGQHILNLNCFGITKTLLAFEGSVVQAWSSVPKKCSGILKLIFLVKLVKIVKSVV